MATGTFSFEALDTETIKGKAFLLSDRFAVYPIKKFSDFLDYLKAHSTIKNYFFYNLDYDIRALLKHLPFKCVEELYVKTRIEREGNTLEYLPAKMFSIKMKEGTFFFWDIYQFYACSLNKACQDNLGESKTELPQGLIENLEKGYEANKELVHEYAIRDSFLCYRLVERFLKALREIGLKTEKFYSCGYLAKKYFFKAYDMNPLPQDVSNFCRENYFGGRIECVRRGTFSNIYAYDIVSAYPAECQKLVDTNHATFTRDKIKAPKADYAFYRCFLWQKEGFNFYPIAHRAKTGLIIYPRFQGAECTINQDELDYMIEKGFLEKIQVKEVLNVYYEKEEYPFQNIPSIFEQRKESPLKNYVLKILLNSLYGIFAENREHYTEANSWDYTRSFATEHNKLIALQTEEFLCPKKCMKCLRCKTVFKIRRQAGFKIGGKRKKVLHTIEEKSYVQKSVKGFYQNYLYASLITSRVRLKAFDKMLEAGDPLLVMTDGILSDKPLIHENEKKLGAWIEEGLYPQAIIIGTGIYNLTHENPDKSKMRLRGYRGQHDLSKLLQTSKRKIPIDSKQAVSEGLVIHQRKQYQDSDFNILWNNTKYLDINFDKKREWQAEWPMGKSVLQSELTSKPLVLYSKEE